MTTPSELSRISVVTPSLNQGAFIRQTIESVRDQGYPALEHLVVDGGSTDGTLDILRESAGPAHLRWTSEPDEGQSDAINKGVHLATGEIVAWLNADDYYYPGALRAIGEAFRRHPDAGLIYGTGDQVDREGRVLRALRFRPFDPRRARTIFVMLQPSMFVQREAFLRVGGLTPSTRYAMDWELVLKLLPSTPVVAIPDRIAALRAYPDTKTARGGWERMREIAELGRRYNGLLDKNYLSFRIRDRLRGVGPRARALIDRLMALGFGDRTYMVQGWPD